MGNRHLSCAGPVRGIFFVFLIIIKASCTVVKEDRTDCPCALYLEIRDLQAWPLSLSLNGKDYWEEWIISGDTTLLVRVPKSGVQLLAVAGSGLPKGGAFHIPRGFDCPPLFLQTEWVETPGDSARVKVQLHKHFCTLSLSFDGPDGWEEPYWAEVRGAVDGLTTEGDALEGPFSCRLDLGRSIRLPRQAPDEELWLDIAMPDRVIRTFALGNYLQEAGYDWEAPDLEDLTLQVRMSVTALRFQYSHWTRLEILDIEI